VISQINRRYIINLLAATCARTVEVPGDSSDDSEAEDWSHLDLRAGSIEVVRRVLDGIAARSPEEGQRALGRYGGTIRLGRELWQSPALSRDDERRIKERHFDDGSVPAPDGLKKTVTKMKTADEKRPEPFQGKTMPHAELTVHDYGQRINEWFARIAAEEKAPNRKQLEVLERVRDRVLLEFRLFKEGDDLKRCNADTDEEPLRGFIHGPQALVRAQ
jgi:hypothetical protein